MASVETDYPSGDFTVLNSTTQGFGPPACGAGDGNGEQLKNQIQEAIVKLCGRCGTAGDERNLRPFRIVIVGKHGAGKSSFINAVAAALSEDSWNEFSYTADMGAGAPVTIVNQRHEKCCQGRKERYREILLPTLIDVAGLGDETDDKMEELLRLLFYGHIDEDEAVMQVYEDCRRCRSVEEIRRKYSTCYPNMRVDRVIFVASAADKLPERLISCVQKAARPSHYMTERRAVPIYGVLTKKDLMDVNSVTFLEMKQAFFQKLGLNHSRFLLCSNYCDDLDPEGMRSEQLTPEIDLPILKFMQQVCNRALSVIRDDEVLPGSDATTVEETQNAANRERQPADRPKALPITLAQMWQTLDQPYQDSLLALVVGVLVMLMLFLLLPTAGQGNAAVLEACAANAISDSRLQKLLCTDGNMPSSWARFQQLMGQLLMAFVVGVVVFLYRYVNRRL